MNSNKKVAITGAFGFAGRYIASKMLEKKYDVFTLTNSTGRKSPLNGKIDSLPLCFNDLDALTESLRGTDILINTYWVRFNHKDFSHQDATQNSFTLFEAAKRASVKRIIHVSITNPDSNSKLEYFRDKALIEDKLQNLGVSYSILRPAVLFGPEDILINNIAWSLRKLPIFGVFGNGNYGLQPIHVDDFANLAVEQAEGSDNVVIDAIGPETFTYKELVRTIGEAIACRRPIIAIPPFLGYLTGLILGKILGDVMITWPEVKGLMQGLLSTNSKPVGKIKLSKWAKDNRETLGISYASELGRRRDRSKSYGASKNE